MDKWTISNRLGDFEAIMSEFGVSEIMARLMVNRGITSGEEVRSFLHPELSDLHSPHLMQNLDAAAELIAAKIASGRRIRVVGDYDVDGIMATYILTDALKLAGADADWYIPHRIRDGYGLNEDIIRTAAADGIDTVVTCDNGISASAASKEAAAHNITLVITDHHEIPEILPDAAVLVDPKAEGETYPCRDICGAVVAAKLAQALFECLRIGEDETRYLEFMAMATICDVVALKGENRVIAKLGMEKLKNTSNYGLAALVRETGIDPAQLSEYHAGFVLGPCFNATGRIDDAGLALELLMSDNPEEASRLALECRNLNEDRKLMTAEQEKAAIDKLESIGELPKVIVLELEDCHESILGIIAGRIKERYNRPAVIVTMSGENYKGSARSIPAYNMFGELKKCGDLLLKFGGHPMAAGLSFAKENLAALRERLNECCTLTEEDMCRKVSIDIEVSFNLFDEDVVGEIGMLAPFGQGNASPLFAERGLKVRNIRYMGKDSSFLKFRLINRFGHEFTAISFNDAADTIRELEDAFGKNEVRRALAGGSNRIVLTAAYVPRVNEFRDTKEMQMIIKALRL